MAKNNYVMSVNPPVDLAVLAAENDELQDYIVGNDLYRTVHCARWKATRRCRCPAGMC